MEANDMSDDKILDMTDFKRVDGEVICTKKKTGKSAKASKASKTTKDAKSSLPPAPLPVGKTPEEKHLDYISGEMEIDEEMDYLLECNDLLAERNAELTDILIAESSKAKTLEKMLNKVLKQLQTGVPDA